MLKPMVGRPLEGEEIARRVPPAQSFREKTELFRLQLQTFSVTTATKTQIILIDVKVLNLTTEQ
jgi:hypothetical protein